MPGETVTSLLLKLLAVGALVLLNGFFVAAELAVVKIRDTQLETLVLKGHRRAKIARHLIRNLVWVCSWNRCSTHCWRRFIPG